MIDAPINTSTHWDLQFPPEIHKKVNPVRRQHILSKLKTKKTFTLPAVYDEVHEMMIISILMASS
jgi:hypothetical protein